MFRYCRLALAAMLLALLLALPGTTQAQGTANVTGTIAIRERIAIPGNAIVTIQLADVSRVGAPAQVIAEQTFSTNGAQSPFGFTLLYDPARVTPNARYIVQGSIRWDNQLRYTTSSSYPVLTLGNPTSNVQVVMTRVGGSTLPNTSGGSLPLLLAAVLLMAGIGTMAMRRRFAR